MPVDTSPIPVQRQTFDDALGRRIIAMNVWALREGLRGATAHDLFDGFCQRLVIEGVPLWRAHVAMETLHPQWSGFGYAWRRDLNAIEPEQYVPGDFSTDVWLSSPLYALIRRAESGEHNPILRRRLEAGPGERDFPVFAELFAAGATDYFSQLFPFGTHHDRSHGSGAIYSFASDRRGGFTEDDIDLLQAALPALSLALKAHVGHVIAAGLLQTYLGEDAGRRVHAGAITRGSVESIRAVLWYADIRGFTTIADTTPGPVVIELLDAVFESLAAVLRRRGGQILKFLGDGMLAIFAVDAAGLDATCRQALDAAAEAMQALDALNEARRTAGKPIAAVDLALHLGEVLYGNVGAVDRLDFTVIGPAVNEVARIETLCGVLGRKVLVSADLAAAAKGATLRLEPLGRHALRGVREEREIYALDLTAKS
ncbi:MAG TPA: adenylate/guanylate cyclase domain-containing protein [Stellaceae bacterium]|nr:adenylate/guanylate cyclase domain-containing protein [Stellaceae bacterium]